MAGLFDDLIPTSTRRSARARQQLQQPIFVSPTAYDPHIELPELSGIVALDTENKDPGLGNSTGSSWPHKGIGFNCGYAVSWDGGDLYASLRHAGGNTDLDRVLRWLRAQARKPEVTFVFANCVYDLGWLWRDGIEPINHPIDVQGQSCLLDEHKFSYSLDSLGREYLGEGKSDEAFFAACAAGGLLDPKSNMDMVPGWIASPYATQDARLTKNLYHELAPRLTTEGLDNVHALERECYLVGFDMKRQGVRVNTDKAARNMARFERLRDEKLAVVRQLTGINCTATDLQSLGRALLVENPSLDLPKTSTGLHSIRKESLETLRSPVADAINAARKYEKAVNTFFRGYLLESAVRGRIHADFNPLKRTDTDSANGAKGTTTGRWSCVASWTLVETDKGYLPIRDIRPGDLVWTHNNRWRRVSHKHVKPKQQMFDVYLSNGKILTCTKNHRLLSLSGKWQTVGDLYELFQKMGGGQKESSSCDEDVSQQEMSDDVEYCHGIENNLAERQSCIASFFRKERAKTVGNASLFQSQIGGKQSQLGKIWRQTSKLEGRGERCEGPHYDSSGGETPIHGKSGFRQGGENSYYPVYLRSSSYRQQSSQQCLGQFSSCHEEWAQKDSCTTETRTSTVQIAAIEVTGSYAVHDITVEDDASYTACGVFSHNCTDPNLQNVPTRDEEIGPAVRECFEAEEGEQWGKLDFSAQEPRLAVHFSELAGLRGAREMGDRFRANPLTDLHRETATLMSVERQPAKIINLAILYGAAGAEISRRLNLPTEFKRFPNGDVVEVAGSEAARLIRKHHQNMPFVKELQKMTKEAAERRGWVKDIIGRRCRFQKRGDEYARAYKACNSVIQSSAASQTKLAQVRLRREGILPLIVVHDDANASIPRGGEGLLKVNRIKEIMESAVTLTIPVIADVKIGENWADVRG